MWNMFAVGGIGLGGTLRAQPCCPHVVQGSIKAQSSPLSPQSVPSASWELYELQSSFLIPVIFILADFFPSWSHASIVFMLKLASWLSLGAFVCSNPSPLFW